MKEETQPEHHEESLHHAHKVGTLREHLVRETLSDLENQLTADHHLDEKALDEETPAEHPGDADRR